MRRLDTFQLATKFTVLSERAEATAAHKTLHDSPRDLVLKVALKETTRRLITLLEQLSQAFKSAKEYLSIYPPY